ncbi:sensor histidine kinase [Agromyces sp. H66]|uniref:sensor histidine kinase n=1 Tax=Agromyces sp. H66 TaxID=2529859 RepID=UPI0010AB06C1|nr:sensor histidine kinase [Agromyces sp. H66]
MQNVRWWDAAAAGVALVMGGILALDPPYGLDDVGAWASIAAMLLLYALLGRRLVRRQRTPLDLVHAALLAAVVAAAVAFDPFMSFLQAFAYPLVWVAAAGLRTAIISNALIALGVGAGYYVGTGSGNLLLSVGISAFSFVFSLVLGLWFVRVAELGEERARLLAELEAVQDELAAMHRDAGVTSERERLAREIHDTLAQSLTGLVLLAQRAGREIGATDAAGPTGAAGSTDAAGPTDAPGSAPRAAETVALIEQTAREALGEARALVAVNAPVRVESDLPDALTRLAERFTRETGVGVSTDVGDVRLARDVEVVLLRCAQEALANVRKHAHATSAVVRVVALDDVVELTVTDDGVGIAGASESSGFGVSGMRERLALVGGRLSLEPAEGGGSVLRATVPAPRPEVGG